MCIQSSYAVKNESNIYEFSLGDCVLSFLQDTAVKRASYVRCVASLLSKCSMNTKIKSKSYGPVILFVLKDIQSVAGSGKYRSNIEFSYLVLEEMHGDL